MILQEYLNSLINDQLKEIRYRFRIKIADDIKNRFCCLLARWDEEEYRETILFTTKEEALYYEPFAENEVRELVVACVRNSLLEIAASTSCNTFKIPEPLSNKKIQQLTSTAVKYFSTCDFRLLIQEAQMTEHEDVYEAAKQKYSLAWSVLKETALLGETQYHFKKIKEEISSSQNDEYFLNNWEFKTAVCDGYTLKFDHKLEEAIGDVISGNVEAFYVDCFKMLSRNFEKILHVLQILLEHDKAFITCNYYISNGHLEKRRKILRAAHTEEEAFKNSQMLRTAPPKIQSFFHMDTYE